MAVNDIGGNLQGDKAEVVQSISGTVRRNITIKEGETADPDAIDALVCGTAIPESNVQIEKMTGDILIGAFSGVCNYSQVNAGNIKVGENRITEEFGMRIDDNVVAQDLQVFKPRRAGRRTASGADRGRLRSVGSGPPERRTTRSPP